MGWWQDRTVQSGALISGPTHISTTEAFHTASPTPSQRLFTHVHKCCSESSQVHMQQGDLPNVALESSVQLPAFWQAAPACAPNESHLSRIIQLGTGQAKQGFVEASANQQQSLGRSSLMCEDPRPAPVRQLPRRRPRRRAFGTQTIHIYLGPRKQRGLCHDPFSGQDGTWQQDRNQNQSPATAQPDTDLETAPTRTGTSGRVRNRQSQKPASEAEARVS